jgi:predicted nucleotidyltransferase
MTNPINLAADVVRNPQVERALNTIVRRIVEIVHPVEIVLFGSAARGNGGSDSDLDLLVVMPDGTHRRQTAQHLYSQLSGIGVPFDLIVATRNDLAMHADNPGLIYKTALSEGRVVYAT